MQVLVTGEHGQSRFTLANVSNALSCLSRERIRASLAVSKSVSVSTDVWTDERRRKYLGITATWVNPDWCLMQARLGCLQMDSREYSSNIQHLLEGRLEEELPDDIIISCGVSDNEAKVSRAVLQTVGDDSAFPCVAHTIELCVRDLWKATRGDLVTPNDDISRVRSVVVCFRNNEQLMQEFLSAQGNKQLRPVLDSPTRWWSSWLMIARFVDLWPHYEGVVKDKHSHYARLPRDKRPVYIDKETLRRLRTLCDTLGLFAYAVRCLEGEHYTTMCAVPEWIYVLYTFTNTYEQVHDMYKKFVLKELHGSVQRRLWNKVMEEESIPLMAARFSVHHCDLSYAGLSPDVLRGVDKRIVQEIVTLFHDCDDDKEKRDIEACVKAQYNLYKTKVVRDSGGKLREKRIRSEQRRKRLIGTTSREECDEIGKEFELHGSPALEWWRLHAGEYGYLTEMARMMLGITASSASTERQFSNASKIRDGRPNLAPSKLSELQYVKRFADDIEAEARRNAHARRYDDEYEQGRVLLQQKFLPFIMKWGETADEGEKKQLLQNFVQEIPLKSTV